MTKPEDTNRPEPWEPLEGPDKRKAMKTPQEIIDEANKPPPRPGELDNISEERPLSRHEKRL